MNTTTSTFGHFSSLFNSPIRKLFVYIILFRLICAGILVWGSYQPPFDASHVVLWPELAANSQALLSRFISTALRWDVFHFQEIARRGYAYEHLYAFLPGTPAVMRIAASTSSLLGYGSGEHIISGTLWICWIIILLCGTSKTLYEFILLHTKSPEMAMLATACSLLPSSPSTLLHAPYAEPFFTFLSFKGMLHCARQNWIRASIYFCLACCFRSNGALLAGYIIWGMLLEPLKRPQFISIARIFRALALCCFAVSPFILHQASGHSRFCGKLNSPEWCHNRFPFVSIYSHVQSEYWGGGAFRYWTPSQLPNFLIAGPPIALLLWAGLKHMRERGLKDLDDIAGNFGLAMIVINDDDEDLWAPLSVKNRESQSRAVANDDSQLTAHAIHALVLTCILLIASHVQIALRLAASLPFTHWAAARLWIEKPQIAKWWTAWSILWGCTSLVTWTLFLPPA